MKIAVKSTENGIVIFNTRSLQYNTVKLNYDPVLHKEYDIFKRLKSHYTKSLLLGENAIDSTIAYFDHWFEKYLPKKRKFIPVVWQILRDDIIFFEDAILFCFHNLVNLEISFILVNKRGIYHRSLKAHRWLSYGHPDNSFDRIEILYAGDYYKASEDLRFRKVVQNV